MGLATKVLSRNVNLTSRNGLQTRRIEFTALATMKLQSCCMYVLNGLDLEARHMWRSLTHLARLGHQRSAPSNTGEPVGSQGEVLSASRVSR